MFTFKPASKSSATGGNNEPSHGDGSAPAKSDSHSNGNVKNSVGGNTNSPSHTPLSGWLGLGSGHKNGNGHTNSGGHPGKIESVIGPGISFQGNFNGTGGIRIEGTFDGGINVKGQVVVTDGAKVIGNIQAFAVTVAGSVQGNITANKVEIRSTGRIFGDLVVTAFATEEGAFLRGQVRMEDDLPTQPPAQLEAPATMPVPNARPIMPTAAVVEPEPAAKAVR
jgi:cytoskeletal protein CcmA (bactofilin family)